MAVRRGFTPAELAEKKLDISDLLIVVACILAILAGMELLSAYASAGESVDYARETLDCVAAVEDSTPLFRGADLDLGEDPQEDAQIEAALVEAGYYRDDVPRCHEGCPVSDQGRPGGVRLHEVQGTFRGKGHHGDASRHAEIQFGGFPC